MTRFRFDLIPLPLALWCSMPLSTIFQLSWLSVLLVEETGVPRENHRPIASHWQTIHIMLHRVHPVWAGFELTTLVVWLYFVWHLQTFLIILILDLCICLENVYIEAKLKGVCFYGLILWWMLEDSVPKSLKSFPVTSIVFTAAMLFTYFPWFRK